MRGLMLSSALVFALAGLFPAAATAQGYVSVGYFYSALDPHGEWIMVDEGYYAWRPWRVQHHWRPYTVGYWLWTDMGWYWYSQEPWGWATYHYGRWFYDPWYGWLWVPGNEWAPAWVEWRYGGPVVGWAPLPPYAIFDQYAGVRYRSPWRTPDDYWIFADAGRMTSADLRQHIYRRERNVRYLGRTRPGGSVEYRGGRVMTRGPEREYVEREGRMRLTPARVLESRTPGTQRVGERSGERTVEVYRPSSREMSRPDVAREPRNVKRPDRAVDLRTEDTELRVRQPSPERAPGDDRGAGREAELWRESREVVPPVRENSGSRPADRPATTRRADPARPETPPVTQSSDARPVPPGQQPPVTRPAEQKRPETRPSPERTPPTRIPEPPRQEAQMRPSSPANRQPGGERQAEPSRGTEAGDVRAPRGERDRR